MSRTKHLAKRSRTKPSAAATPSATPSKPARKSPRTAPETLVQKPKQKRRYRPGTKALREIRHFQKTWDLVVPAAPFIRLVREISHFFAPEVTRWQAEALIAIQEAAEDFLVHLFEDAMLCAIHARRVTLNSPQGSGGKCSRNTPSLKVTSYKRSLVQCSNTLYFSWSLGG